MSTGNPHLRYEDAAEWRTGLSGWCCIKCSRHWGTDEHMARYCCGHDDQPCRTSGCTERAERGYGTCKACQVRTRNEQWLSLPRIGWDGKTPLCVWDDDRYFFDDGAVADHVAEVLDRGGTIDDVRLVLCEPDNGRHFEMIEYLCDHLPDEDHGGHSLDTKEIDGIVNKWIDENAPFSWHPTNVAVSVDSIKELVAGVDEVTDTGMDMEADPQCPK